MSELPLRNLHERHRGLTVAVAGSYEEAAAVCLQRHHTPPVDLKRWTSPPHATVRAYRQVYGRDSTRLASGLSEAALAHQMFSRS
jgi:hypothetical protein